MEETIQMGEPIYVKETGNVKKGDIVVFDFYGPDYTAGVDEYGQFNLHWEKRICRITASSGDSIEIKNDTLYINGVPQPFPPGVKLPYEIYAHQPLGEELLSENELMPSENPVAGIPYIYTGYLSADQVRNLKQQNNGVEKIQRNLNIPQVAADSAYAKVSDSSKWNTSNYGPLKIPSPGEMISVNKENFKLYHNIPGIKIGTNKISEMLYFVMGDNRHMAEDSRYVGFIPHSNIYGLVK